MDCHFSETSGNLSVPWVFPANHKDSDSKDFHWSVAISTKIARFWWKFNQKRLSSHTQPGWDIRETIHAGEAFAGAYEYMDHTWSLKYQKSLLQFVKRWQKEIHCPVELLNTNHNKPFPFVWVNLYPSPSRLVLDSLSNWEPSLIRKSNQGTHMGVS